MPTIVHPSPRIAVYHRNTEIEIEVDTMNYTKGTLETKSVKFPAFLLEDVIRGLSALKDQGE